MSDPTENGDPKDPETTTTTGDEGGESTETTETTTTETTEEDPFKFEDDGVAPTDPEDKGKKTDTTTTPTDDELPDEDKKTIQTEAQRVVDQALEPLRAEQEKARVSTEWSKMVTDYPELKNYEAKILRYAQHQTYKGQPITKAIMDVAGVDVFVKIGASRARVADTKAKETKGTATTTTRPEDQGGDPNAIPSFVGMKPEDMKNWINKARQGQRGQ